jgi:hypothetical protein
VRNSEHLQAIRQFEVDNVVGESPHEDTTDCVVANSWGPRPNPRVLFDPSHRGINGRQEFQAEADPIPLVPARCFRHLGVGLVADPNPERRHWEALAPEDVLEFNLNPA